MQHVGKLLFFVAANSCHVPHFNHNHFVPFVFLPLLNALSKMVGDDMTFVKWREEISIIQKKLRNFERLLKRSFSCFDHSIFTSMKSNLITLINGILTNEKIRSVGEKL